MSYYEEFAWGIAQRRTKRGRKYIAKHGGPSPQASEQFLISHGFVPNGPVSQEMLDRAHAKWQSEEPPPHPNPTPKAEMQQLWAEATKGLSHDKSAA